MLGPNRDAHVHAVRHQMPFQDLALLLPSQSVENLPQMTRKAVTVPWEQLHRELLAMVNERKAR